MLGSARTSCQLLTVSLGSITEGVSVEFSAKECYRDMKIFVSLHKRLACRQAESGTQ